MLVQVLYNVQSQGAFFLFHLQQFITLYQCLKPFDVQFYAHALVNPTLYHTPAVPLEMVRGLRKLTFLFSRYKLQERVDISNFLPLRSVWLFVWLCSMLFCCIFLIVFFVFQCCLVKLACTLAYSSDGDILSLFSVVKL